MAAFSLQYFHQPFLPCLSTSALDASVINYCNASAEKPGFSNNDTFVNSKCSDETCYSVVDNTYKVEIGEQVTQNKVEKMEKKRVIGDGSSPIGSSKSMDGNEMKSKRQKKSTGVTNKDKEQRDKKVNGKKDEKKTSGAAPVEYVHVRAKRGQATDSHSLAERVRREKISERMKRLQGLVPGCDKITGKALMLDEIINYVQSLQNQVEFLSRKLSSLNPMLFEFGVESGDFNMTPEAERLNAEPPIFSDTINGLNTQAADTYPLLDHATSSLLFDPQIQRPNIPTQDNGQYSWDVILDDKRRKFNN